MRNFRKRCVEDPEMAEERPVAVKIKRSPRLAGDRLDLDLLAEEMVVLVIEIIHRSCFPVSRPMNIESRKRALEIFRGTLPPQRSEEAQGRKMSSAKRDPMFIGLISSNPKRATHRPVWIRPASFDNAPQCPPLSQTAIRYV